MNVYLVRSSFGYGEGTVHLTTHPDVQLILSSDPLFVLFGLLTYVQYKIDCEGGRERESFKSLLVLYYCI